MFSITIIYARNSTRYCVAIILFRYVKTKLHEQTNEKAHMRIYRIYILAVTFFVKWLDQVSQLYKNI